MAHLRDAGAAVALDRGAEKPGLAVLPEDVLVEGLVAEGVLHARAQVRVREPDRG